MIIASSGPASAAKKTNALGYEISNDTVSVAGSSALAAIVGGKPTSLMDSVGQPAGYTNLFQTAGNYTSGYMLESGYLSGIEAVFDQFNLGATVVAPVALGYLGGAGDAVPGARITYLLTYSNKGEAAVNSASGPTYGFSNMIVEGHIPPEADYEPGTIRLNGAAQTDAADFLPGLPTVDNCNYDALNRKVVCIVLMTAGATGNVQYSAIIK